MKDNKHYQAIPESTLAQAQDKIAEATELLKPYLTTLTTSERQEIPKMGPKTLNFVEKSHSFAHENPELVPPYLKIDEFDIDFADARNLWNISNSIRQLEEGIEDTQMTSGSEAFQAALIFYNSVKLAASQGIGGAKAVYEELKERFPGGKKRSKNEANE